jgi:hypothetical protein
MEVAEGRKECRQAGGAAASWRAARGVRPRGASRPGARAGGTAVSEQASG